MSTPEPPAPTPSATTATTPRAGCASCGKERADGVHYVHGSAYRHAFVPPVSAPACINCGKLEAKHVNALGDGPGHFCSATFPDTGRFQPAPASAPAATPDWSAWKSHLIVCADCSAGETCSDGRAILGPNHEHDDAPWLAYQRPAAPTGEEAETTDALLLALREAANAAPQGIAVTLEEARDEIIALRDRLTALREDAERWRFINEHAAEWHRREDDDGVEQTYLVVRLLRGANLSSRASREDAIDAARAALAPRQPTGSQP